LTLPTILIAAAYRWLRRTRQARRSTERCLASAGILLGVREEAVLRVLYLHPITARSGGLARIAKLYAIEADVRGLPPDVRRAVRQERSRPLVGDLHRWLQDRLPRLPGWSDLAKAMRYVLRHWDGLILYLDDGRLEVDTNVVERAIRPVTITRKNSLFAGSDAGVHRWAIANTLIQTCKLSGVDPLAWLTDVLQRIV
jgi:hypothetical protein